MGWCPLTDHTKQEGGGEKEREKRKTEKREKPVIGMVPVKRERASHWDGARVGERRRGREREREREREMMMIRKQKGWCPRREVLGVEPKTRGGGGGGEASSGGGPRRGGGEEKGRKRLCFWGKKILEKP